MDSSVRFASSLALFDNEGTEGLIGVDLSKSEQKQGLLHFKKENGSFRRNNLMNGSSFYDLTYFKSLGVAFGFEVESDSGIANLRKISATSGWVYKIKSIRGYYNENPGKQLRKNPMENILGIVTNKNRISLLTDLGETTPRLLS